MESMLVLLHIFFFVKVCTTVHDAGVYSRPSSQETACPVTLPVVDNANISVISLKSSYSEGDTLLYICQQGYVSLRRIIYICDRHQWVSTQNAKCSPKHCELPADLPNGHYIMVHGTDFVYGTTIKYICTEGYQMVSREDTRTCLAGGWSNRLPVCEEITCSPPQLGGRITVDGLTDYDTPLRYGHSLRFTCAGPGLRLVGPREITCHENGDWSSPFPRCEDITCELEEIKDSVSVVGLSEYNAPLKYGHKLQFSCTDLKLSLRGSKEVTCSASGSWSSSFPTCEVVTCKIEQLNNVRIVIGSPPYKPGHTLHFQCTHSSMDMLGPSSITCQSDGTWSSPYPTCSENGACGPPPHIEFAETTTFQKASYRPDESVKYICHSYHTMDGNPYMTCTKGKWKGYVRCLKPCTVSINDMDVNKIEQLHVPKQLMYSWHNQPISFKCQHGTKPKRNSVQFRQTCVDGVMPLPACQ
ncbi:complement factor H-like [Brachyhypopomus gauderio]|uniref:complement factor H-like n=1 Tax=Brachyhypopomus gauderio TaxID=698409 RepID=UPI004041B972